MTLGARLYCWTLLRYVGTSVKEMAKIPGDLSCGVDADLGERAFCAILISIGSDKATSQT
jgi:hypothetical protein